MQLPTFFRYFGSKSRSAKNYPKPQYKKIIEPFAGAAGYSHLHYQHDVELYDTYGVVYGIWSFLIRSSKEDILRLPVMRTDQCLDDIKCCEEAKNLIGFYCISGMSEPHFVISKWQRKNKEFWNDKMRSRVAENVQYIKHWKIYNKSYSLIPNEKATWFIDPPYQKQGKKYVHNDINYHYLANWSGQRKGQYIVCEQYPADWLPFEEFRKVQSGNSKTGISKEVIFTNSYD